MKKRNVSYDENIKVSAFMKDYVTKYTNYPEVTFSTSNISSNLVLCIKKNHQHFACLYAYCQMRFTRIGFAIKKT